MASDVLTIPICAGWIIECRTRRGLMDKHVLSRALRHWERIKGTAFVEAVQAEVDRLFTAQPSLRRTQSYKRSCLR